MDSDFPVRCPKCGKRLPVSSGRAQEKEKLRAPHFPFCSERCRLLDLGSWYSEDYKLSRPSTPASPDDEFYDVDPDDGARLSE